MPSLTPGAPFKFQPPQLVSVIVKIDFSQQVFDYTALTVTAQAVSLDASNNRVQTQTVTAPITKSTTPAQVNALLQPLIEAAFGLGAGSSTLVP
jgi:hypothetical protein